MYQGRLSRSCTFRGEVPPVGTHSQKSVCSYFTQDIYQEGQKVKSFFWKVKKKCFLKKNQYAATLHRTYARQGTDFSELSQNSRNENSWYVYPFTQYCSCCTVTQYCSCHTVTQYCYGYTVARYTVQIPGRAQTFQNWGPTIRPTISPAGRSQTDTHSQASAPKYLYYTKRQRFRV